MELASRTARGLLLLACTAVNALAQGGEDALDRDIPAAQPTQYRAVAFGDWKNPWVDVEDEGFRLRSLSIPEPRFIALTDLRRALTQLPTGDWPYGRVVVIQEPSISGHGSPESIRANFQAARGALAALGADWWAWPP